MSQIGMIPVLAGIALVGLVGRTVLGSTFDLSEHLDPDTAAYVAIDDLGSSWSGFADSPLGRTFADPEIAEFLTRLGGGELGGAAQMTGPGRLPIRFEKGLDDAVPSRAAFALLTSFRKPGQRPGVVGALSLGEDRDALVTLLGAMLDQLRSVDPESSRGRISTIRGEIHHVAVMGVDVSYFWTDDDTLVLGTRRADLVRVLSSIAEPREDSLAAVRRFRRLRRRTEADSGGVFLYLAADGAGLASGASLEGRIIRALGIDGIEALGMCSAMGEDGRGVTRLRILQPGENRGWLDVLGRGEGPFRTADYLSPRAVVGLTVRIDARGLSRLASRLTAALGVAVHRRTDSGLVETPWPIDLARSLGDEAGLYLAPPRFGILPEFGMVVRLRDPARAEHALVRSASSKTGIRMRTFRRKGRRYFRLDPKVTTPMLTSATVADGVLVAGTTITVVDDMLRRAKVEDARSLGRRPEFRRVVAAAPSDASAVLFVDTPRVIRWVYEAFGPFIVWGINISQQNRPGFKPMTWADFPSSETLTQHLGPAVTWFMPDEDGLTAVSHSDVQSEITVFSFLAGAGLTTFGIMGPRGPSARTEAARPVPSAAAERVKRAEVEKSRRRAWCRLCRTNLEFFRHTFFKYRKEHGGRPPPDLAAFFGPGPARGPQFLSPADLDAWKARREGKEYVSSYLYIGPDIPTKVANPKRFAVVWNRAPFHENRRLVLFLSGDIRLLPEPEFQKVLAETRALSGK